MATVTALAWLGALLVIVLLAATIVALVRLLVPKLTIGSRALKITIVLFALLGAAAVANGGGMLLMHLGMSAMGCCQAQ